jgi:hypothetical protein
MPSEESERASEAAAELLRERLGEALPMDKVFAESIPQMLMRLRRGLAPLSNESLGELLRNPATHVALLTVIKDYTKKRAANCHSVHEHRAAVAIYFAAIASALVFHKEKISTHSYETLETAFIKLAAESWMPPDLLFLFEEARSVARTQQR